MKPIPLLFLLLSVLLLAQCDKENPCTENCENGYCSEGDCICDSGFGGKWCLENLNNNNNPNPNNSGTVTFWADFPGPPIRVSIDSIYRGQISQFFATTPDCNSNGTLNIELNYGQYNYEAVQDSTGITWSNTFTLGAPCVTYRLTR